MATRGRTPLFFALIPTQPTGHRGSGVLFPVAIFGAGPHQVPVPVLLALCGTVARVVEVVRLLPDERDYADDDGRQQADHKDAVHVVHYVGSALRPWRSHPEMGARKIAVTRDLFSFILVQNRLFGRSPLLISKDITLLSR